MRFLRMLTNSLLAGALGAAYLTILVLQLNPQVPLASTTVVRWYATLGAFYGIQLAVLFYVTMVLREFVSLDVFSPGWVSVRLLAWLSAVAAAVAALADVAESARASRRSSTRQRAGASPSARWPPAPRRSCCWASPSRTTPSADAAAR